MSEHWTPLRDYLRDHLAAQFDEMILHDRDPEVRAMLAARREFVLNLLTDQAELHTLRNMLAAPEQPSLNRCIRFNGKRCVRRERARPSAGCALYER